MRDNATGRSRGFGFLTFKDAKTVNIVMVKEHFLDGKIVRNYVPLSTEEMTNSLPLLQIDPKRAIPRDEQEKTSKIFVGGVSQETTDQEFKDYFAQFGRVVDATLMMDKDTGRPRGFGFVTFENEAGVDACINVPLEIHGKPIEVKKAQPRGNLREEEDAQRRMKFQRGNEQSPNPTGMAQGMGGNTANSMTPQMMAQYFQRMNQYFAMMQSQMAMRGMQMNPGQMQNMMQMQQMQQMMGRGGPGGQNMMNPQMMQQMQQQMQQQQQMMQQQQQQGGDGSGGFDNYGGGAARGGFQHQPRGGRRGGFGGNGEAHGGAYGGGGGGGGSAYGGQQSYEGMYDDIPQGSGQNAPPANAPTGPKNAGKPGANYRGGGRGGSRGFHPYAR